MALEDTKSSSVTDGNKENKEILEVEMEEEDVLQAEDDNKLKPCTPVTCDLSSSGSSGGGGEGVEREVIIDRREQRKVRREKRKQRRRERLKRCCHGCDNNVVEVQLDSKTHDLPPPLAVSTKYSAAGVIKVFEEVVHTCYNSEDDIDAAINSYSTVGNRLARANDENDLSDVEISTKYTQSFSDISTHSDDELPSCPLSSSVGEKLANRKIPADESAARDFSEASVDKLEVLLRGLQTNLNVINLELVNRVQERDNLVNEKSILLKHIAELTSLVQGKKPSDRSAFRKLVVKRETTF